MSDPEPPKKKSWGCLQWVVVLLVVGLLGLSVVLQTGVIQDGANKVSTANNARSIIMAMKLYASENGGVYPDSHDVGIANANQMFRELFRESIVQDERVFGAKASKFIPDGDIGKAPAFDQALSAGENHWAWVAGQGLKSPGHYPLIFENAIDVPGRQSGIRNWRDSLPRVGCGVGTRSWSDSATTVWLRCNWKRRESG